MSTEIFHNTGFLAVLSVLILVFICMAATTALRIRREVKENKLVANRAENELRQLESNSDRPRTGNSNRSLPRSFGKANNNMSAASSLKGPKFGINALHQGHAQNGIPITPMAGPGPNFRDSQRSSTTMSPIDFLRENAPFPPGSPIPPRPYCSSVPDEHLSSPESCHSGCTSADTSRTYSDRSSPKSQGTIKHATIKAR